jgi:hypothetical protein
MFGFYCLALIVGLVIAVWPDRHDRSRGIHRPPRCPCGCQLVGSRLVSGPAWPARDPCDLVKSVSLGASSSSLGSSLDSPVDQATNDEQVLRHNDPGMKMIIRRVRY